MAVHNKNSITIYSRPILYIIYCKVTDNIPFSPPHSHVLSSFVSFLVTLHPLYISMHRATSISQHLTCTQAAMSSPLSTLSFNSSGVPIKHSASNKGLPIAPFISIFITTPRPLTSSDSSFLHTRKTHLRTSLFRLHRY